MLAKLCALTLGLVLFCFMAGCDANWLNAMPADSGVVLAATAGVGGGDLLQTRTRLHQILQDGSGDNCPNPDCNGDGTPDRLQLRDGSCGD